MVESWKHFFEEASAKGTKSSVLYPLLWIFSIISAALVASIRYDTPTLVQNVMLTMWVLVLIIIVGLFIYLLIKNPDALRSERFTMYKMAIEKALVGDNIHGLIKPEQTEKVEEDKLISIEGKSL